MKNDLVALIMTDVKYWLPKEHLLSARNRLYVRYMRMSEIDLAIEAQLLGIILIEREPLLKTKRSLTLN